MTERDYFLLFATKLLSDLHQAQLDLHLGSLRTALFNYLFAKQHSGQFILRIEDTDQKRIVSDSIQRIIKTLDWLGIEFDKGPHIKEDGEVQRFIQSERLEIYNLVCSTAFDKWKSL